MNKIQYWYTYRFRYWIAYRMDDIFYLWQKVLAFYYRGKNKNKISHWFQEEYWECVLCGSTDTYKGYMYGKRPKRNGNVLYIRHETMCDGHYF